MTDHRTPPGAGYAPPRTGTGRALVADHRFALAEGPVEPVGEPANGLVQAVPGGIVVRTGTRDGFVPVTVRVLAAPPGDERGAHTAGYAHEIAEVSYEATAGAASVAGAPGLQHLTPPRPGPVRARVHAYGRDDPDDDPGRDPDDRDGESVEILVWEAPAAPPLTIRATDRLGHRLRGETAPPAPERPWRDLPALAGLGDSGTITVVSGLTPGDAVSVLGGDPDVTLTEDEGWDLDEAEAVWAVAVAVPGGAVLFEQFGTACSRPGALERLSADGRRAGGVRYGPDGDTRVLLAGDGTLRARRDIGFPAAPERGADPAAAAALAGLELHDWHGGAAKGLLAVARFTGLTPTRADIASLAGAGHGHRIPSTPR